jgi:hypothetical protein
MHGQGKFTWDSGLIYADACEKDQKQGRGAETSNDTGPKQNYIGMWKKDVKRGWGTQSHDGKTVYAGEWEYGKRKSLLARMWHD